MSRSILPLAAVAALTASRLAHAQAYSDPGFGIGGHAAYTESRGADSAVVTGGLHARLRLTGGLGAELLATYRREEYSAGETPVLRLQQIPVQGSILFFFLFNTPFQPYALAGAGYYWVRATPLGPYAAGEVGGSPGAALPGRSTENRFAFHAGLGLDVRATRTFSVHADARYVLLDVDALQDLPEALVLEREASFVHATFGLTLHF